MKTRIAVLPRKVQVIAMVLLAIAFAWSKPAQAQVHPADSSGVWTPAGTVIHNTATADYKDANGNGYTQETASVDVTVGFRGQLAVLAQIDTITVTQGTSNQSVTFHVWNYGNGKDFPDLSGSPFTIADDSSVFTITGYCYVNTSQCYATPAALQAAYVAANDSIAAGGSMDILVKFNVRTGSGGLGGAYTLTTKSLRDGSDAGDHDRTGIGVLYAPSSGAGVTVVATNPTEDKLPNGSSTNTTYMALFTVTNTTTGPGTFSLTSAITGSGFALSGKLYFGPGCTTEITGNVFLASTGAVEVCVEYTIGFATVAGTTGDVKLTATESTHGTVTFTGTETVTVIKPKLVLSKKAFVDNGSDAPGDSITTQTPKPGDFVWYRIIIENSGSADAQTITVDDQLDTSYLIFVKTVVDNPPGDWTISPVNLGHVVATLNTLAKAPASPATSTRVLWIKAQIK